MRDGDLLPRRRVPDDRPGLRRGVVARLPDLHAGVDVGDELAAEQVGGHVGPVGFDTAVGRDERACPPTFTGWPESTASWSTSRVERQRLPSGAVVVDPDDPHVVVGDRGGAAGRHP